ncbi:MAG: hypothetical protein NTV49_01480 [Kiritimatiellaeota bacterium]|nr:hypothetical protein [Kiritimatiellota bacterium]
MKTTPAGRRRILALTLLAWPLLTLPGCEDHRDEHIPPAGLGSVIIHNHTIEDIRVFINGFEYGKATDDATFYDLKPGVYRFALSEQGGDRSYAADVDVLQGRLTFLDVYMSSTNIYAYDVLMYFD